MPPPSSSKPTSSPVTARITSGPVMNMCEVPSAITTKSVSAGEYTAPPALGPRISEIWGMTPDAATLRRKISANWVSAATPSWIRAPPPSRMPISGTPVRRARSITLVIFWPCASPREPPKTVKSWEYTHTWRPSTVPWPTTTPSPRMRLASSPNAVEWCRTRASSSTKLPSSSRAVIRSRAVFLPRGCWRAAAASSAVATAASIRFGRSGRTWQTPPGSALTASVLLRPAVPVDRFGWLSLLGGLAVVRALTTLGVRAVLKWPNDVLVAEADTRELLGWGRHRKVAGVLADLLPESAAGGGPAAVIGIRVNVSQPAEELPVASATSLAVCGVVGDRTELLAAVVASLVELDDRRRAAPCGRPRRRRPPARSRWPPAAPRRAGS